MSLNVSIVGIIPYPVSPDDAFQVEFDIEEWLGTDTISSFTCTAVDEDGEAVTAILDSDLDTNTDTIFKPWLKGGGTANKQYTVKCKVVTTNAHTKSFYIKFGTSEPAS